MIAVSFLLRKVFFMSCRLDGQHVTSPLSSRGLQALSNGRNYLVQKNQKERTNILYCLLREGADQQTQQNIPRLCLTKGRSCLFGTGDKKEGKGRHEAGAGRRTEIQGRRGRIRVLNAEAATKRQLSAYLEERKSPLQHVNK